MSKLYSFAIILIVSLLASTVLYIYLRRKTKIRTRFLYIDNVIVAIGAALLIYTLYWPGVLLNIFYLVLPIVVTVTAMAFLLTMVRFWRTPRRKVTAGYGQIVSPADGNIIYIKKIEKGEIPRSVKGSGFSRLGELTKTSLLDDQQWHIGINMTPFDVHKNCTPVSGKVILTQHFRGKFLSLKDKSALTENERNTYVIQNEDVKIGVVQIASRLVRRIDSYVKEGDIVSQGEWIGMIRFGSQVDILLPAGYNVMVNIGDQVYAATTIIAERNEDTD